MIESRLMAPGTFTVPLIDATPEQILELTGRYLAAVYVVNGHAPDPARMTNADLLAAAFYVGIHTQRGKQRRQFGGYGQAWLLKLAKTRQDQDVTKRPLYNGSATSWLRNNVLRLNQSENNGLTVGSATASSATPTKSGKVTVGQEPLEILGDVARRFGVEWTCDRGVVNVAARGSLFEVTPTAIAVPVDGGDDVNLDGLEAAEFDQRTDVDDYATTVAVPFTPPDYAWSTNAHHLQYFVGDTVVATDGTYYECIADHVPLGPSTPGLAGGSWPSYWQVVNPYGESTVGSVPYVDPFGGQPIVSRRVVSARNATNYDDAGTIADAQLGKYDRVTRAITLDLKQFAVARLSGQGTGKVTVGDNIYVFSPDDRLVDLTAQVPYRGRRLPAATVRVHAMRTAVDSSMSVLVRSWDGSSLVTDDVTPWVDFEDRSQSLELGEARRRRPVSVVTV